MTSKRTPEDLWKQLALEAGEEEIERAASVSVAQAERELHAAGFDIRAERAKGNALLDELASDATSGTVVRQSAVEPTAWVTGPQAPRRRSPAMRWTLLLAATLAAATAGGLIYALGHRSKPNDKPVEGPRETPTLETPAPPPSSIPSDRPSLGPDKPAPPRPDSKPAGRQPADTQHK
jgi:hypothetical protein